MAWFGREVLKNAIDVSQTLSGCPNQLDAFQSQAVIVVMQLQAAILQ